ncbi:MAG: hypothetical protein WDN69_34385 [Aliidongia sp.]
MPRLIAATAGGNTASATPVTACPVATTQKPGCDGHCNGRERDDDSADCDQAPLPANRVDQRAGWRPGEDGSDPGDRQHEADAAGIPMLAAHQKDCQERAEPVLDVGEEEIEPVERRLIGVDSAAAGSALGHASGRVHGRRGHRR